MRLYEGDSEEQDKHFISDRPCHDKANLKKIENTRQRETQESENEVKKKVRVFRKK
jgi:hypothetical protein